MKKFQVSPDEDMCRVVYVSNEPPSKEKQLLEGYPDLLSISDMHKITGISESSLRVFVREGKLPGCRIGRRLFVSKSIFIDFISRGCSLDENELG